MRESGEYPDGAEFDPRAPWNQYEICSMCEQKVDETFELDMDNFLCEGCLDDTVTDGDPELAFEVWLHYRGLYKEHADLNSNQHRLVLNVAHESGWLG